MYCRPKGTVDQHSQLLRDSPGAKACQYSTWNQEYVGSIETAGLAGGPSCGFGLWQHVSSMIAQKGRT
eukprot:scaffold32566_cov60-Phaeocystis_antarctica.AAC.2